MKTFYTEHDITDMRNAGVIEIEVDDDVVLTDLAREKAIALGLRLKQAAKRSNRPAELLPLTVAPQIQPPPATNGPASITLPLAPTPTPPEADMAARVKAAVIARLGSNTHNDLLDQIIPQVLARLKTYTSPIS